MNDEELQQTMATWRALRAKTLPVQAATSAPRTVAERRAALGELRRRYPLTAPPQAGLFGETAGIVRQWLPEWTRELANHPRWQDFKRRLGEIRDLVVAGEIDYADSRVREIFLSCIPATRRLGFAGLGPRTPRPVEEPSEDAAAEQRSLAPPDRAAGLSALLDWLERQ